MKSVRLAALFAATILSMSAIAQTTQQTPRLLTVSGNGEVRVAPDHASITLGIVREGKTAAEAQLGANEVINRLLKELEALKIPKKDIQTSNLNLYPRYSNPQPRPDGTSQEPRIIGYGANQTVTVTVWNFDQIGQVVDRSITAGVNQIQGVQFGLRDDSAAKDEALKLAVRAAKRKAGVISSEAGVNLGDIFELNESGAQIMPPPMMYQTERMAFGGADKSTSVEPGQITVTASVTIRYRISTR